MGPSPLVAWRGQASAAHDENQQAGASAKPTATFAFSVIQPFVV